MRRALLSNRTSLEYTCASEKISERFALSLTFVDSLFSRAPDKKITF